MTLRPARPEDVPALAALAAATFPLACPPDMPAADQQEFIAEHLSEAAFTAHLATPGHLVLVAAEGTELLGYTLSLIGEPLDADLAAAVTDPGRTAYLSKCYVSPAAQGSGLARELMTATLDALADTDATAVVLGVNGQNARAQSFYRRAGFAAVGERHFTVGRRVERDLVLYREL